MVSSAKRERNLGIELLRIITTFSILVLHTQEVQKQAKEAQSLIIWI